MVVSSFLGEVSYPLFFADLLVQTTIFLSFVEKEFFIIAGTESDDFSYFSCNSQDSVEFLYSFGGETGNEIKGEKSKVIKK